MCVILAEGHPQNSTHFRSLSNAWDSHQATPRGMMQILTFESAKRILCAVTVRAFPCASSACVWGGQACAPVCIWRLKVWLQVLFCGCLRFLFWGVVTNWPGTPKEARQASLWVSETPILPTQNYTNICHHAQWLFYPSSSSSPLLDQSDGLSCAHIPQFCFCIYRRMMSFHLPEHSFGIWGVLYMRCRHSLLHRGNEKQWSF